MTRTPQVAVAVVHYGDPEPLHRCLEAILADPSSVHRHIAVADNSANLNEAALPQGVHRVVLPENPGFGAGIHRALEALEERAGNTENSASPYDAYVILNHDVRIAPGYLEAAVQVLSAGSQPSHPIAAAAGPLYLETLGEEPIWYAGGAVRRALGIVVQSHRLDDAQRARDVTFLPGAALVAKPDLFAAIHGFDERFFLYNEDLDLCLRWLREGHRLRFDPRLAAVHPVGAATGSAERSPLYLEELSAGRLRPFRPLVLRLWLAALHSVYVMVRALFYWLPPTSASPTRAAALLQGHRRALATVLSGPRNELAEHVSPPEGAFRGGIRYRHPPKDVESSQ